MKRISNEEIKQKLHNAAIEKMHLEEYQLFSAAEIEVVLTIACQGIIPNGNFSDNECCLWSLMRNVMRQNDVIFNDV